MLNPKDIANLAIGVALVVGSVIVANTALKDKDAHPVIPAGKVINSAFRQTPVPLSLPSGTLDATIDVESSSDHTTYTSSTLSFRSDVPTDCKDCPSEEPVGVPAASSVTRSGFALPIFYPSTDFRYNVVLEANPSMPWSNLAFRADVKADNEYFPVTLWRKDGTGQITKIETVPVPYRKGLLIYNLKEVIEGDTVYVEYTPALTTFPFASIIERRSNDPITFQLIPVRFVVN